MREHRRLRDQQIEQRQSKKSSAKTFSILSDEAVRTGTQTWIQSVISGGSPLCPFAKKYPVSIVVCHFMSSTNENEESFLNDCPWFVYKAARELMLEEEEEETPDKKFHSALVVFPYYDKPLEPLYDKIVADFSTYVGSISNRTPKRNPLSGEHQQVQAIPFDSISQIMRKDDGKKGNAPVLHPLPASAPWATIQLLRYSDLSKLSTKMRQGIMNRNDEIIRADLAKTHQELIAKIRKDAEAKERNQKDTSVSKNRKRKHSKGDD